MWECEECRSVGGGGYQIHNPKPIPPAYIYIYTQEARNKKQEKKKIIDQIGTLSRSEKRPRRIIIFARRKGKSWFVPPHPLPRLYIYIYIYIFDS